MGEAEAVERVKSILENELEMHRGGRPLLPTAVAQRLRESSPTASAPNSAPVLPPRRPGKGKAVRARTEGQKAYLEAMRDHEVVFGVGPAGTGKTYLAVAAAVQAVKEGRVKRIVLVRPAVEAGEKLGFLPGDFQQKIDPYLRPLHDALHNLLDPVVRQRYLDSEVVEVCPLAYMRGRTLNDAFVILDEAQNSTVPQMMMFLTRMGEGSHVVVTGDPSQIDLPRGVRSGLDDATHRLDAVEGIAVVRLKRSDVVRHPIVQRIIEAYDD